MSTYKIIVIFICFVLKAVKSILPNYTYIFVLPCENVLAFHAKLANYQAFLWNHCLLQYSPEVSSTDHGCIHDGWGNILIYMEVGSRRYFVRADLVTSMSGLPVVQQFPSLLPRVTYESIIDVFIPDIPLEKFGAHLSE